MQRASASVQQADVRRIQQAWLPSACQPMPVALAHELVDAAAREVAGTNTRDARGNVEAQFAAGKVPPRGYQDLVRQELLQLARKPKIDVLVPIDQGGARDDAQEPRA